MSDNGNDKSDNGDGINDPLTRTDVEAPRKDWQVEGQPEEDEPA